MITDFSELKSSSDDWRELSWFPASKGRIAPVESDGSWNPLDVRLMERVGVALRAVDFRRRSTHRTASTTRARTSTPVITPAATIPPFTREPSETGAGDVTDGLLAEDGLEDGEGVEVYVMDRVEDDVMEDCDETARHERSVPLATLKTLDDRTPPDV